MYVAWRALIYLRLNVFIFLSYISAKQRGKTKKRPTWLLFTEIEKVVQNATLERGRMTYVWENRVPLCLNSDWTWDWVKARTQD